MAGNKRRQWGVCVGEPFDRYRGVCDIKNVGAFCAGITLKDGAFLRLFFTKEEAEKSAISCEKMMVWHYHAKKYLPKRDEK